MTLSIPSLARLANGVNRVGVNSRSIHVSNVPYLPNVTHVFSRVRKCAMREDSITISPLKLVQEAAASTEDLS